MVVVPEAGKPNTGAQRQATFGVSPALGIIELRLNGNARRRAPPTSLLAQCRLRLGRDYCQPFITTGER